MFKKLQIQLTALCILIAGTITITMTCFSLYVSERGLSKTEYGNFLVNISAIYSHLKNEINLTTEWFEQTEHNGKLILYIEDNGFSIKNGNQIADDIRSKLITDVRDTALKDYKMDISNKGTLKVISKQQEFIFKDENGKQYYASAANIPKDGGYLGVLVIFPLERYRSEILLQRFLFAGIAVGAIILFGIFSYFFTKKMLKPIEENRKKQVEFIASASHELRSPLTVITSGLSAMKKADENQAQRIEEIIDSEISRMTRLVNDMLSLASADSSTWSLQFEDMYMDVLLLNIYEAFLPVAKKKNIHLSVTLPETPLPPCKCDKQRIEQVLTILVDNALSYSRSGDKVNLSIKQRLGKLEIHVADTGIGISDGDKKHIFDRFYRADSAHKNKEHFGLGLCIANEIIKLHKGSIAVTDTAGGGTTFIVTLG